MNQQLILPGVLFLLCSWLFATVLASACNSGNEGKNDAGADTDTDIDIDTDSDTDSDLSDCSSCVGPVCINAVAGHVEDQDGTPLPGNTQICFPNCMPTPIDENGDFYGALPSCLAFDFSGTGEPGVSHELHITLFDNTETHTRYSVDYQPAQEEVSDLGTDDFVLDVGTLKQYELPAEGVQYTSAAGATVNDLSGVSFVLEPEAITCPDDADTCTIKVLDFPLDEWTPPFVPHDMTVDALYYLTPYLTEVAYGVALHIDPATAGWSDGDTGSVFVLGDYTTHFVNCGGDDLPSGKLVACSAASYQAGEIVTDALPFLGFIALVKN